MDESTRQLAMDDGGIHGHVQLIPPLAEEFSLYGEEEAKDWARMWALQDHWLLVRGVANCAHGLYLFPSCPSRQNCANAVRLDHVNLWVRDLGGGMVKAMILAHQYAQDVSEEIQSYGRHHGLRVAKSTGAAEWYGSGTIGVELQVPEDWPLWPIEREATLLLVTQPVRWQGDI